MPTRVRFFLLDGDTNASSRHRVLQYLPLLRADGFEPRISRPVPQPLYARLVEAGRAGGGQKAVFYSLFLALRCFDVLRASRDDVAVIQRDLFPFGPPLLERLLRRVNPRLVYDTDDATYLRPSFTPDTLFQRFRRFDKVAEVVRHARWVSVATEPIAAWARQYNAHVSVVPMAVDLARYEAARQTRGPDANGGGLVVGWAGTAGSLRYLEALVPVLGDVLRAQAARTELRVVSGAAAQARLPGLNVVRVPWRSDTELRDLASFDVGIVPLDGTPFERAKFPFKLLQFMALGLPVVCARVGAAAEIVQDGENGLLAASPAEWRSQLERVLRDSALRRRLGDAARETVRQAYTVERVGPKLASGLRAVARGVWPGENGNAVA